MISPYLYATISGVLRQVANLCFSKMAFQWYSLQLAQLQLKPLELRDKALNVWEPWSLLDPPYDHGDYACWKSAISHHTAAAMYSGLIARLTGFEPRGIVPMESCSIVK